MYQNIDIKNVVIHDSLFSHYVDLIADVVIPYQWEVLNDRIPGTKRSYCLENFRIASGQSKGKHNGTFFLDTDLYKWLEAVAFCIASGKGKNFEEKADEAIDLIAAAQWSDGYLNTYITLVSPEKRWTNLLEGHELYSAGHLIEAAVAYFQATSKRKLLDVAIKFADLITKTFGREANQINGYPGHQEIELALIKLYRITGNKEYLKKAEYFINQRGSEPNYFLGEIKKRNGEFYYPEFKDYDLKYSQSHMQPVKQTDIEGHAVRAMYMCSAMADIAVETDDDEMKLACKRLWQSVTQKRMYIIGGIGSSGLLERFTTDYDLPNDTMYCETCASVGLMMFGQRMASLTGNASYYDNVERALYNTVLAGINADGRRYFYVNPLEVWPARNLPRTSLEHVKSTRQPWFDVACCPTNIARTLASLGQYIYAIDNDSLCIHQFISSSVSVFGTNLSMNVSSDGSGKIELKSDNDIKLKIRIPQYASDSFFTLSDSGELKPDVKNNYAIVCLKRNETLSIDFHIKPTWIGANNQVRTDEGKLALCYGPFVYCLEETDNGKNLAAIYVKKETSITIAQQHEELPGSLPYLSYEGLKLSNGIHDLYGKPDFSMEKIHLTAVPYCLWCNRIPGEMLIWQKIQL